MQGFHSLDCCRIPYWLQEVHWLTDFVTALLSPKRANSIYKIYCFLGKSLFSIYVYPRQQGVLPSARISLSFSVIGWIIKSIIMSWKGSNYFLRPALKLKVSYQRYMPVQPRYEAKFFYIATRREPLFILLLSEKVSGQGQYLILSTNAYASNGIFFNGFHRWELSFDDRLRCHLSWARNMFPFLICFSFVYLNGSSSIYYF